jgi:hypothetical protein
VNSLGHDLGSGSQSWYRALVAVVIPSLAGGWRNIWSMDVAVVFGSKKVTSCQLHGVDSPIARGDTALQQFMCYNSAYTLKEASFNIWALICVSINALYTCQSAAASHKNVVIFSCNHAFVGLSFLFLSVQIVSLASYVYQLMLAHDIACSN